MFSFFHFSFLLFHYPCVTSNKSTKCITLGNGSPLQYSCLDNTMGRGAWYAAVHGVVKSRTRLSNFPFTFHFHALEKEMATHSSILAWKIPWTEVTGGLHSPWGCKQLDMAKHKYSSSLLKKKPIMGSLWYSIAKFRIMGFSLSNFLNLYYYFHIKHVERTQDKYIG